MENPTILHTLSHLMQNTFDRDGNGWRACIACTVYQYCHTLYPQKTGLAVLRTCLSAEECTGHEITRPVDETITVADDEKYITDESLTQYEVGMGLEPTWETGYTITEVVETK